MRNKTLRLYKDLLRYGENLQFTDKSYFQKRIRQGFQNCKDSQDEKAVDFQFQKGLKLLTSRRVV